MYTSFEENDACILCGSSDDDPIEFGKKCTKGSITIHHFCAVSYLFCFALDFFAVALNLFWQTRRNNMHESAEFSLLIGASDVVETTNRPNKRTNRSGFIEWCIKSNSSTVNLSFHSFTFICHSIE